MKYFDTVEAAILKRKTISFLRRLSYNFFSVHTEEIITKKNRLESSVKVNKGTAMGNDTHRNGLI